MECKESRFTILCKISYHYIYHLSKGESTIFLQQKCYCIGESKKGAKSRLGTDWAQIVYVMRWIGGICMLKKIKGIRKILINLP
jgi:hypothetical protein